MHLCCGKALNPASPSLNFVCTDHQYILYLAKCGTQNFPMQSVHSRSDIQARCLSQCLRCPKQSTSMTLWRWPCWPSLFRAFPFQVSGSPNNLLFLLGVPPSNLLHTLVVRHIIPSHPLLAFPYVLPVATDKLLHALSEVIKPVT